MKAHFFISDCDGALHDTRAADWSARPLRPNYSRHHGKIETLADVKATLRAGKFAFPGGYGLFFIMADGEALSFESARAEFPQIVAAFDSGNRVDGWRPVATATNWEDDSLYCAHSGDRIEPEYS